MSKNFWKNKNVLITGATGFVGSHLSRKLLELGANVVGVNNKMHQQSSDKDNSLKVSLLKTYIGNVSDQLFLQKICIKESVDTIFHLAASSIVSYAAKNPFETLSNNFLTTLSVLETARVLNIKRTVVASSDKAYGDHTQDALQKLPYKENYTMRGLDMYSVSKATADTIAQAYALQFKMPVATLRFCNIYGPGDLNFTRLIPRNALLLLSGQRPTIKRGHENVLREYLYIDDAVKAYLVVAENIENFCGDKGEKIPQRGPEIYGWLSFNGGSYSKEYLVDVSICENIASVSKVIQMLRKEILNTEPIIVDSPQEYVEIPDEYLDSSKLVNLGFSSSINLQEGLKLTSQWYKDNFEALRHLFLR